MVTLADIEAARRVIAGQVLRTPMLPAPKLSALTGAEVFVKYENLQVTNSFKERGAVTKLASLDAAERRARRDRHVGRQPRSGGRLSRGAPRHSGHHRDAGGDALREGGGDQGVWRGGRARGRGHFRGAGARRGARGGAQPDLGPPLRRSVRHRRPGHDRAGDAGGGPRSRRAGDPDRRRGADRRQRGRRPRGAAGRSRWWGRKPRSTRRCGTRSTAPTGRAAGRRSPRASR